MNIAEIKQLNLVDYLYAIGVRPAKESDFSAWYHAPYREDRTPSFKVNKRRNIWYDFGTGQNGDIIDLGCLIYRTKDISQVIRMIGKASPVVLPQNRKAISFDIDSKSCTTFQNVRILPLTSFVLKAYISSRGINIEIAERLCKEIHYTFNRKNYFALAFPNEVGGYEIRNPYYKGCISPKGISVISNGSITKTCCLLEGFIDYLSFMTAFKATRTNGRIQFPEEVFDCIVLNSVNTLQKALPKLQQYHKVYCYLDNDDAGHKVVDFLKEMNKWDIHDMMKPYPMYKDVNDLLRDKKKMP